MTSNTFNSLQPEMKESYSDKKDKFHRIKKMWGKKSKKATAERDASKNPKKIHGREQGTKYKRTQRRSFLR